MSYEDNAMLDPDVLMTYVSDKAVKEDDSALFKHPYTAYDVKQILKLLNVKSNEICGALKITSNQWATMTRVCKDGRDMDYEFTAPSIEMFIRLAQRFPQYAPWTRVPIVDVCKRSGWSLEELAFVCGVPLSSFERYQNDAKASMTAQTAWLMNFIYNLLKEGIEPQTIKKMAEDMYTYRNELAVTKMTTPSSWSSVEDQDYRKVRKTIRSSLNTLLIDGKEKVSESDLNKIISGLYRKTMSIKQVIARSSLKDDTAKLPMRFTLEKCFQWLFVRESRLKLHGQIMRTNELSAKENLEKALHDVEIEYRIISKDLERLANIEMGIS